MGGSRCTQSVPSRTCPPPPGKFLHFFFSEVTFSAFSGKNSAQNLINYIKILTAIINSYQSCSNSNDPLNILHECCDTNLLMISFNNMSTKRGGSGPPGPPPLDLPLLSGYWQVEVDPEDREKTAFCTHEGLFEFHVMPFGFCNAPATYQRLMAGLQWSSCIDDLVIPGKTFLEHLAYVRQVFQRLKVEGLKLKPSECNLCLKEVEFLGHLVSADGVRTDPRKTDKVATWPVPTSKREVQQFWDWLTTTGGS